MRNIPTMSEWGLIAFAAFVGIAGIWFLRRRQVTA
ncbi:MAG: IPTL-CTERM sorting domain-containing protein [Candidatus Dadabacteria bacterium]|nr:IPTL-CTERM sorting domain-containing protein [Candidatus Dadabacteria bacterium]